MITWLELARYRAWGRVSEKAALCNRVAQGLLNFSQERPLNIENFTFYDVANRLLRNMSEDLA